MYQIHFGDAIFAQSAKYVFIAKNAQQTKRSEVCSLWTSAPVFNEPIILNSLDSLLIKACTATIDRKLSVIGSCEINQSWIKQGSTQTIYEAQSNLTQNIEGKEVPVGSCYITIKKRLQSNQPGVFSQFDQEFQMRSQSGDQGQQKEEQQVCDLKFIFHGGSDFYLNSGFKISVSWASQKKQTPLISNRINPFWGTVFNIQGKQTRFIEISVVDVKGNKLQWLKIDPKQIRIMYPYHFHVIFREEYVGMNPHFYFSLIRQDVPKFSILDRKINIKARYIGPFSNQKVQHYLLIYKQQLAKDPVGNLPGFITLEMKNYISLDTVNKLIEKQSPKYENTNWNILYPIQTNSNLGQSRSYLTLLKSSLSKSIFCLYFTIDDVKLLFSEKVWNVVKVIDKVQSFENIVKEIYYQEKSYVVGKMIELGNNDLQDLENEKDALSLQQKWKMLSHNYMLRKELLTKSIESAQLTKKQIKQKGQLLQQLKKIMVEVKKVHEIMNEKQKSSLIQKTNKKVKENLSRYSTIEIITLLLEKQVELERKKKINDQMRMRMKSLYNFSQDSSQLDKIVVENAENLLEQQQKIKQMEKIRAVLPKQREVILKLEKLFEKREIDKSMNDMLNKQQNRLKQMKRAEGYSLEKIYHIVKDHKNHSHPLIQSIKAAQGQLVKLNAHYAKLTTS